LIWQEFVDNARNPGTSGFNASEIHIALEDDNLLTILDNGRGLSYAEVTITLDVHMPWMQQTPFSQVAASPAGPTGASGPYCDDIGLFCMALSLMSWRVHG